MWQIVGLFTGEVVQALDAPPDVGVNKSSVARKSGALFAV
jgi:hypothetical protein